MLYVSFIQADEPEEKTEPEKSEMEAESAPEPQVCATVKTTFHHWFDNGGNLEVSDSQNNHNHPKIQANYEALGVVAQSVACLLRKHRPSRPAHSFMEKKLPLLLIQEEQVVSYWQKNGHFLLVNCLQEACPGAV